MEKYTESKNKPQSKIEIVQERFEDWRRNRVKRGPIPEALWEAAMGLYPQYSILKIAKTLRLNYARIKTKILNSTKKESHNPGTKKQSNDRSAKKQNNSLPLKIEKVREQLKDFRKNNRKRSIIPETIWKAAIDLYPEYSVYKIARALQLDYASVKKRILKLPEKKAPPSPPAFIQLEIPGPLEPRQNEWSVEIENVDGAKIKIGLKSTQMLDIAAICQSFLRG